MCTDCGHVLSAKDMVPIFSWLMLKGRCRYCNKSISWQYPVVEAATAFLFAFSYAFWPYELSSYENLIAFIAWLIFLTGFISLTIYDIKYLILPNKIIFTLIFIALIGLTAELLISTDLSIAKAGLIGTLIGGGLFYVLFQLSNGAWIGGGDVKLGFLLGLLVGGPWPALLMLFLASFLGTIYSIPMIIFGQVRARSRIPFGPFLIAAAIIVQLFGVSIIDWYNNLAGTAY